jgi:cytochrome c
MRRKRANYRPASYVFRIANERRVDPTQCLLQNLLVLTRLQASLRKILQKAMDNEGRITSLRSRIRKNVLSPTRVPLQGTHYGMEAFMPRIPIVGLACSTFLILLSSAAVPQEPVRAGADAGSGQLIFNNACRTCHTTKEGDNRLGPNLHNIIGRKAGSLPNFGYSSAMKGADFVWDTGKLDSFIAKPDEVVPGNNMKPYGGLASAEDRTKLIAFLQSPTTD